jgi:hypothetical protein
LQSMLTASTLAELAGCCIRLKELSF